MADIVTSRIFTDGEKGITAAKLNDIVASSVIQPAFVSAKPVTSTADPADNMLILKAAGTYAQVPVSTLTTSIGNALPSQDNEIWLVRLRSFNAVSNPNFEIAQRNTGALLTNPATNTYVEDRWQYGKSGTSALNLQRASAGAGGVFVPGTNYRISINQLQATLTTQQASLGVSDYIWLHQVIEGPMLRELSMDVHSISLLVYSSVAGLKFTVVLRDVPATKSLVKLCTVASGNTWTLIQLPNIPVWPSGNFSLTPGIAGYELGIVLAAGANQTAPAADTWQTGSYLGAPGMSNWAASPVNSSFSIGMVQDEPGPVCSTLMDKPFTQNLDECLRYYQKSYDYGIVAGTVSSNGAKQYVSPTGAFAFGTTSFSKLMAKTPTVILYNPTTGAANSVRDGAGTDHASATVNNLGQTGFNQVNFTTATTSLVGVQFHYTADTGW
jgi:hypothetical protein